jgi:hypothetical protein
MQKVDLQVFSSENEPIIPQQENLKQYFTQVNKNVPENSKEKITRNTIREILDQKTKK